MAPGSKKNSKAKSKRALSVDFKRVKSKVGRKLAAPQNATKVEFKAKGIIIPGQSIAQNKDGLAVNQRRQTLKELLQQTSHYNEKMRKDALLGLKDLFARHPKELTMHAVLISERLSPRVTDSEKSVRQALIILLRLSVLPNISQAMMKPLVPVIMAHVCSAMTHLVLDIRVEACTFLDLLVQHCSALVVPSYTGQIIQHYISLLGRGGISEQPGNKLISIYGGLEHFLSGLKLNMMSQRSQSSVSVSTSHKWGSKTDVRHMVALHAYKCALPENDSWKGEGLPRQVADNSKQLVSVLLECWAEYAPLVCTTPSPDASTLDCMVLIARCLCLIFQSILSGDTASFAGRDMADKMASIYAPVDSSDQLDTCKWMREEFLPSLSHRLLVHFPQAAPVVRLVPKVEEGLVALNVGICEVMLQFINPLSETAGNGALEAALDYFEGALYGTMLPSSQFSDAALGPKVTEPYIKTLVSYLPRVIGGVSSTWVLRLLKAFTHVSESCNSRSSVKLLCLSVMTELVLPKNKSGDTDVTRHPTVPTDLQKQWLQPLPKLLWELKSLHPNVSEAVLDVLLYMGRSSAVGSPLAESFNQLQQAIVPFFCTFIPSKQTHETRCHFGPFVQLPQRSQELATDLCFYYTSFSPLLLKALAQCVLYPDVDVAISTRIVEVLQAAFCRGAIALEDYLSFLFTLLAGHTSSKASASTKQLSAESISGSDEDLTSPTLRRHFSVTGVVCACLVQAGDGDLILSLLDQAICKELTSGILLAILPSPYWSSLLDCGSHVDINGKESTNAPSGWLKVDVSSANEAQRLQLKTVHGFLRVVAVLSRRPRPSMATFLPDSLATVLPNSAAQFLVNVSQIKDRNVEHGTEQALLQALERPLIFLLAQRTSFMLNVLEVIYERLCTAHSVRPGQPDPRIGFARAVLDMIKNPALAGRFQRVSKDKIRAIVAATIGHGDSFSAEERELQGLHEQLHTTAKAVFGSEFGA